MRTFHIPSRTFSTTNGRPSRRHANVVQSMIDGSALRDPDSAAAANEPSASKIPARKPLRHSIGTCAAASSTSSRIERDASS